MSVAKIEEVIRAYLTGYQNADTKIIQETFHPETRLMSVNKDGFNRIEMKDWLVSLAERNARKEIRSGEVKIESIDATENAAAVKLKVTFPKSEITDYLSLLKIEGKWIIVGKIYHFKDL